MMAHVFKKWNNSDSATISDSSYPITTGSYVDTTEYIARPFNCYVGELKEIPIEEIIKNQKREQKFIDRAAWNAEAKQRYAKGRHFK
jgi:hypothetical protein